MTSIALTLCLCVAIFTPQCMGGRRNNVISYIMNHVDELQQRQDAVTPSFGPICEGRNYQIYLDPLNWSAAKLKCEINGGMLAKIRSQDIHVAIVDYIKEAKLTSTIVNDAGKGLWIGLGDKDEEGRYMWVDGEELDLNECSQYQGWAADEPNNNDKKDDNGQDCVQLWKMRQFDWDDGYCNDSKGYICEYAACDPSCVACL
ncbi:struthiocalcin-2-like [Saccoglossus kowalevskii]|uniref:Hepatic lectin-like n=1 Tax=Saccoglossus kowalevskii TaxID=10224 RepID=A0ABM0H0A1_SACKO|nr:PREDICTED: hepatic lectin-like [Saccoglossus kowalevskii]